MNENCKAKVLMTVASLVKHAILIFSAVIALFPVIIIVLNSVKARLEIFNDPYSLPTAETGIPLGMQPCLHVRISYYITKIADRDIPGAISDSVSWVACFLCAYEYHFRGNNLVFIYFILGIMIPIRLGSVGVLKIMSALKLTNTLWALV
jgi:raffinose/stachyose/melibiose transport system permease protein